MGLRIKSLLFSGVMLALVFPVPTQASELTQVVISEIKLGGAVSGRPTEFVQIYNNSNHDVTNLKIEYAKPGAGITDCALPWKPQDSANVREVRVKSPLAAKSLVLVEISMNDNVGGSLKVGDTNQTYDIIGWGKEGSNGTCFEGDHTATPSNGKSLKRYVQSSLPVDTDNNAKDFSSNQDPLSGFPELLPEDPVCLKDNCSPPEPKPKECEVVELSEILPNPGGTDSGQEYIELYNPTNSVVSLDGCSVSVGSSTKNLVGDIQPGYTIITGLALPNSAGGTVLLAGSLTEQSITYPADMPDDEAWALIDGAWQRTNQPTPNLSNLPSLVSAKPSSSSNLQPCAEGKYRNPETNRCKTKEHEGPAPCAPGQVRNQDTNRCRKLTAGNLAALKPCEPGQERNPATNRCRKVGGISTSLKQCAPGQERNPETNRCRKVAGSTTLKASTGNGQPQGNSSKISYGLFAMLVVVVLGYGIYEYRQEIRKQITKLKINKNNS